MCVVIIDNAIKICYPCTISFLYTFFIWRYDIDNKVISIMSFLVLQNLLRCCWAPDGRRIAAGSADRYTPLGEGGEGFVFV